MRRSVLVFVSAFMLGTWSASLDHNPLPERLVSAFTWFAGGIVGVLLVAVLVARVFFGD